MVPSGPGGTFSLSSNFKGIDRRGAGQRIGPSAVTDRTQCKSQVQKKKGKCNAVNTVWLFSVQSSMLNA